MSIQDAVRDLEAAVGNLKKIADGSTGWSDQQRVRFDQQRLTPLLNAGAQLGLALRLADEKLTSAQNAIRESR